MFLDVPLESSAAAAASSAGILFDAGEGTAGALAKACGSSSSSSRSVSLLPSSLRAVWLSHRHADHVLGLLGVLEARREEMMMMMKKKKKNNKDGVVLLPPPLLVVGPHSVGRWIAEASAAAGWNDDDDNGNDENPSSLPLHTPLYRFASASSLYQRHDPEGGRRELESALGLEAWVPVRADHCSDAHGAVLWSKKKTTTKNSNLSSSSSSSSSPSSWSLAVSGDTVPTEGFARASRGVDLLVHEATFASGEGGESHAARKRHSTAAGALAVAAASGAKRTILTHFSQRYPGLPPDALQAPEQWDAARAVAAADGMAVRFADLGRLEGLTGRTVDALGDDDDGDDGDDDDGEGEEKGKGGGGDRKSTPPPAAAADDDVEDYYEDDCCCDGD